MTGKGNVIDLFDSEHPLSGKQLEEAAWLWWDNGADVNEIASQLKIPKERVHKSLNQIMEKAMRIGDLGY